MKKVLKVSITYDAVHKVMDISKDILNDQNIRILKTVIDSFEFQRLRSIKQLGVADLVFPTATHTRFSHSFGTAFLASKIIRNLKEKHAEVIPEEDRFLLILSALLHDIGHGPFSHTFEIFINDIFQNDPSNQIRHEHWTQKFIRHFGNNGPIRDYCPKILSILQNQHPFCSLVSSQLDCDRLDYLLRDSHFCGVSYGNYDLGWLLNCLVLIELEKKGTYTLGITKKGIGAVENFLMGRRLMYRNICQNKNLIGFEDILIVFLKNLLQWIEEKKEEGEGSRQALTQIVGIVFYDFMVQLSACRAEKKSTNEIIDFLFDQYRLLTDFDIWQAIRNIYFARDRYSIAIPGNLFDLAHCLITRKKHKVLELKNDAKRKVEELLKEYCLQDEEHEARIIEPYLNFYQDNYEKEIFVITDKGRRTFSELSGFVKELPKEERRLFIRCTEHAYNKIKNDLDAYLF